MSDGREPLCLALVLCDGVYYDPWTNRKCLMGLLPVFASQEFPCTVHGLTAHVVVSDGRGQVRLSLRLVDGSDNQEPLAQAEYDLDMTDPLKETEFEHVFPSVQFPHPGEYHLQLYANGTPLMERRLLALPAPPGDHDAG